MLKKLKRSGGRNRCALIGLAGLCVMLISAGGCKKMTDKPDVVAKTQDPLEETPAEIAAMEKTLSPEEKALRDRQMAQLKAFAAAKEAQAMSLATGAGETLSGEARQFFDAARRGDNTTVRAIFRGFSKRHPQYANSSRDETLVTSYWSTMIEVELGYEMVVPMDPKSVQLFVDDTISSIPAGSIYFGGTDSGRGLITAFCKSHADADPFFTLTQNALADPRYLTYLRAMYGSKIYIATADDSAAAFESYMKDAQKRLEHDQQHPSEPRQIKPGENVQLASDGRVSISSQVSVMEINGLLVKTIFDHNPGKEFYVEESFPLDWMYPYLEPHGTILKLNHEKLAEIPDAVVMQDRAYWHTRVSGFLGDWLTEETPVAVLADFAEKTYAQKDLRGFAGSKPYLGSLDSQKVFSKLRSSIGRVYDWRRKNASSPAETERMTREADLAYREAFALCPALPETVLRYMGLLIDTKRYDDAILVASASLKVDPKNEQITELLTQVTRLAGK